MQCQECQQPLNVARGEFKSEAGSTEVYLEQTLVCVNPKCGLYCGKDLNNPLKVAQVVKNKVN
jgi:hypothetical protein